MAKLFEGTMPGRPVTSSLETSQTKGGHIGVSAKFTFEKNAKAKDEHGRACDVGGTNIIWYGTVSSAKTRNRMVESLVACGMNADDAETVIASVEEGQSGKIDPPPPGFGSRVVDLVCEIDEYQGKKQTKVRWINEAGATGPKRDVPTVKLKFSGKASSTGSTAQSSAPAGDGASGGSDIPYDEV